MVAQIPRPYQTLARDNLRVIYRSKKSCVLVAPTGSGKTTIASMIIDGAVKRKRNVLFLAHRKELIDQCSERLDQCGIDHGIIKNGNKRRNSLPVQVASLMTIINRVDPNSEYGPKYPADLIIIDECHRAVSKSYKKVISCYPNALILGLTATPCRTDGRGLADLFEEMVIAATVQDMIDEGFLVNWRLFSSPLTPDFTKVKKKGNDFDQEEVERIVDKPKLIGDIYENWARVARDRQTVIFATTCNHAQHIRDEFVKNGVACEYVDGEMDERLRAAVLDRFKSRATQVVVNVGIMTEGYDNPEISCVVLARPTQSLSLYLQMCGRGLRPASWIGKINLIIIDHGGNTKRHGYVSDEREWTLEGKVINKELKKAQITCKKCFATFKPQTVCPECGIPVKQEQLDAAAKEDLPKVEPATLIEIDYKKQIQEEILFFAKLVDIQKANGYKEGYAKAKFFEKYGKWPSKTHGIKKQWEREYDAHGNVKWKVLGVEYRPPKAIIGSRERATIGNFR